MDSSITEELTLEEGCSSPGDEIAGYIANRLSELSADIENTFEVPLTVLLADFVASPYGGLVNIPTAQNIAAYFPHIKDIDDLISADLSNKYGKEINTNVTLHSESLEAIFSGEYFEELPLNFQSIYTTSANSSGWYQEERINAERGYISDSGILYREHCSETDNVFCNENESLDLSLIHI